MDVLVRLDVGRVDSPLLAQVDSIPVLPFETRARRAVVTLYNVADAYALALALAATMESERLDESALGVVRQLGVCPDTGAMSKRVWRDDAGRLVTRDLNIPMSRLELLAAELLGAHEPTLRRVTAGISVPDWPQDTDRAASFSLATLYATASTTSYATAGADGENALSDEGAEQWLDAVRSADAFAFDMDHD